MINRQTKILIAVLSLFILYDLKTLIEYTIGFPERKVKIDPKIQEIIEIEKNTELVQKKLEKEKKMKEEQEYKIAEENYIKSITPTKEEIRQSKSVYKILNYNNCASEKYKDLLKKIYLEQNKDEPDINARLSPGPVEVWEIDLDNDKDNEIIGFINDAYFYGSRGRYLYILKKINEKYVELCEECSQKPGVQIEILNHKTNNFYDIKLYSALWNDSNEYFSYVVQYRNNKYTKAYRLKEVK